MEWKDLSDTTACVLERCWGLYDDKPRTRIISIDEDFYVVGKEHTFTEENYKEIVKYAKLTGEYTVNRVGDVVTVRGKEEL